jgi:trimeric autotransporter adhesin
MREPSVSGIRGLGIRGCLFALLVLALFGADTAQAQAFVNVPTIRLTGNFNFTTTGGSLRAAPNVTNACTINTTSTQALNGIPAGRTVEKAYLYWGASGTTADTSVTLNGNAVNASRTFARTFNNGTAYQYFGGFADVTTLVTGNGSFVFGGLTVSNGTPWCGSQAVVGGWALVVVYKGATERLRAINIFDGLDYFYGSSVTLNPGGFRIPASNIDGRVAVFTLEGDPQNSGTNNGFSEALRFNGALLDDGLVPANSDPAIQQFDGTVSTVGSLASYGIDVDQYDVSATLSPGQTSATTVYSAGDDLVLLMAQIISATSDPAVDLSVTKTHTGNFVSGGTGQYTITVSNAAGVEREDNIVTVTDTLPAGLTFNSATGTGWVCAAVGQVVTCTHAPALNAGASFPPITLTVNVLESAAASVGNTVTVSTPSYDPNNLNNTVTDTTITIDPAVSTSTKTVVDLNGGEVSPGDTLRYTVTLNETAGGQAINVSVVDAIPDNTTFASFVSVPAGATTSYLPPPAGTGNNGQITVSGITVPASGSVAVVFDVTVVAGTAPGETIDNTAVINNPNGPENSPTAPQLVVNPSLIPVAGVKFLYLRRDASANRSMSRVRPTAADTTESVAAAGSDTWVIAPALQKQLVVPVGNIPVRLWLSRNGGTGARNITVTLSSSAGGLNVSQLLSINPNNSTTTPALVSFTLNNTVARTVPAGATLTLTVANAGSNAFVIWPNGNGGSTTGVPNNSRVELNTTTVINVDSVLTWDAAYNGGALQNVFYPGATVFVRGTISDPFGSFDISSARITMTDAANVVQVNDQVMTAQGAAAGCGLTTSSTCVFQYQYTLPASPSLGAWSIRVTGNEGVEGTVTDFNLGSFTVVIPQPSLTIVKSSTVLSDPTGGANPKRIPLAVVRYDISVTNSGPGTVDSNTLVITDPVPTGTTMYVATAPPGPVVFTNGAGTSASGLTFVYASNVTYSSVGESGPWTYVPVPDANGYDANVKAVRVAPGGIMSAAGTGNPTFTVQFRVRIN